MWSLLGNVGRSLWGHLVRSFAYISNVDYHFGVIFIFEIVLYFESHINFFFILISHSYCSCPIACVKLHLFHRIYHITFVTSNFCQIIFFTLPLSYCICGIIFFHYIFHIAFVTLNLSHWKLSHCICQFVFVNLYAISSWNQINNVPVIYDYD